MRPSLRQTLRRTGLLAVAVTAAAAAVVAPTTVSATTTTPPAPSCGGVTLYKSSGAAWQCTWDDEFDGTTLDGTKWAVQTTAASGFLNGPVGCFVNTPNNVSVANGVLSLTARKEAAPFTCKTPSSSFTTQYTVGEVMSYGKFSQTYGRFEVRASFPATTVAGLQSALWLFPQNFIKYGLWPRSGEIDIAEEYSRFADRAIPFVHYLPAVYDPNMTNNYCLISNVNAFHTYAVEWTPSTITISFDGNRCLTDSWTPYGLTAPAPFNMPFVVALTQALGVGGNAFNPATTPLPAMTQVDYLRVWS
jgi:beta-glucanase (GH16 family)